MLHRISTGIPGFDKLIEGGFIKNSVNLLCGGTGTGKTIFCLQFILNGARQYGERGYYISFEETEDDLKQDVEGLGLDFKSVDRDKKLKKKLKSAVKSEGLDFDELSKGVKFSSDTKFAYVPVYDVTDFVSQLKDELQKFKPKRVVIDSISAVVMPMEDDFERRKQIFKIIELLKSMDCTTILISETPTESAMDSEGLGSFSRFGIEEFLSDSVTVLHYAGIGGESDRAIRVVKMRRTNHKRGPIPMKIGGSGITVLKSRFR
ncbi:AAA family ATPase [Candidatus Woesearchaeota archaeon]|nr:AAA family ATPase [Candidatus Woesearchaeota archaeon]